jgi:hypothetical protein
MGNAQGSVYNDTDQPIRINSYNYADAFRSIPRDSRTVAPGEKVQFDGTAHGSGLIISTEGKNSGKHIAIGNGETMNVSRLMSHGDANPSYDSAMNALKASAQVGAVIAKSRPRK